MIQTVDCGNFKKFFQTFHGEYTVEFASAIRMTEMLMCLFNNVKRCATGNFPISQNCVGIYTGGHQVTKSTIKLSDFIDS